MEEVKQINIKNQTYYFYNAMINLKNFEPNFLKIHKNSYRNIGYITIRKIDDYGSIYSANPCFCMLIMQKDIVKKKIKINT